MSVMRRTITHRPSILEVCVDSIESALNAYEAGADRLELCAALSEGGLTPTVSLFKVIKDVACQIPVFCMIRPRGGPMIYSELEKKVMISEAKGLKEAGADGLVFGALTLEGKVDRQLCEEILKVSGGLPCTFHRAFDLTLNPLEELEVLITLGFHRVLTSGCKSSALAGAPLIKCLVQCSANKINIMAGAGVRANNCLELIKATDVKEIHTSAKMKRVFSTRETNEAQMGDTDDNVLFVASKEEIKNIKKELSKLHSNS